MAMVIQMKVQVPNEEYLCNDVCQAKTNKDVCFVKHKQSSCIFRSNKFRPKSTPPSSRRHINLNPGMSGRPRTATRQTESFLFDSYHKLYQEPVCCRSLPSSVPVKRQKPPPWLKYIEKPLVPFLAGPGYLLSRSKSKYSVTIKDEFFDRKQDASVRHEDFISKLNQQITDLNFFLEEERLKHKETKHRAAEFLKEKLECFGYQHKEHIRDIDTKHEEAFNSQKSVFDCDLLERQATYDSQICKLTDELESLQGAFEAYKKHLLIEMLDKWRTREEDVRREIEKSSQAAMHDCKIQLIQERNVERCSAAREHHEHIHLLRNEHKRELDALVRRFSHHAADMEQLKWTTTELEDAKAELGEIKECYVDTCRRLDAMTRTLADTKLRLSQFEHKFEEKVREVDDRYHNKMQDLVMQNIELRQLYLDRCNKLYEAQSTLDRNVQLEVNSAKDVLQLLFNARHKAGVSVAMLPDLKPKSSESSRRMRPSSAPSTRSEIQQAFSTAGSLLL